MTMVVPCRLITRHRSHIGLTEARTFMLALSSVSVGDSTAGQVVGGELDLDLVARKDADVVLPHLSRDRREDAVTAVDLHSEHRAGQSLDDLAFDLDLLLFLRHPSSQEPRPADAVANGQTDARQTPRGSSW